MPKVSVIIPTYNRAQFVTEAIDSVLAQTFRDFELIVVDDGSIDDTETVLTQYGERIRYIYQANRGVGAARNAGIRHAKGEWLAFLDSDDVWQSDYLACQMEQVNQRPAACMSMTNSLRFEPDGVALDVFRYFAIDSWKDTKADTWVIERPLGFILQKGLPYLQATVFKREAFLKAGPFNERVTIAEDLEAIANMSLQGHLSICKRPLVHIIRRKESISNLSSAWSSNQLYCRNTLDALYEGILIQDNITGPERKIIKRLLSDNKKSAGTLCLRSGEIHKARCYYKQALLYDRSFRSLAKVLVSYLPLKVALSFTKG